MKGVLVKLSAVTLGSLLFCGAALAQIGASCNPIVTNPPPAEAPAIEVEKVMIPTTWTATTYDWDVYVTIRNVGPATSGNPNKLLSVTAPDSAGITAYIPNGTWSKTANPAIVGGGNASLSANTGWTGLAANANLLTVSAPDSLGVGESVTIKYSCRMTHGGAVGPWTDRAWARGLSAASTVVTDESLVTLTPPPAPENPKLGIALDVVSVTGTGPYTATAKVYVKNLGNVKLHRPDVDLNLATAFGASGSSFGSVSSKVSKRFTANASYNGNGDTNLYQNVTSDSLMLATPDCISNTTTAVDTVTVVFTFTAGTATQFSIQATGSALGPSPNLLTTSDTSDWGNNPDPSSNCNPGDFQEDSATQFSIPASGTAATSVEVTAAGNWVGSIGFSAGALTSTQLTSGTGIQLRNAALTTFPTQYRVKTSWEDGSPKVVEVASTVPAAAVYDIIQPGAAQTGSVITLGDPFCDVVLNGVTYAPVAANFTAPQIGNGLVWREGYWESAADANGLVVRWYLWSFAGGQKRCFIAIRNANIDPGNGTEAQFDCGAYGSANANEKDAIISVNRRSGNPTMLMRWAADSGQPTGNQATLSLWNTTSYVALAGSQYSFGGRIRAGEELRFMLTNEASADPPMGWQSAGDYKLTRAFPNTGNLVLHRGVSHSGADSLVFVEEARVRRWVEEVDSFTPRNAQWKQIRDIGQWWSEFDSGSDPGPGGSWNVRHDQYEFVTALTKHAMSACRSTADTLVVGHPSFRDTAWKLAERCAWSDGASRMHCSTDYNYSWANGMIWPHQDHGSPGLGTQSRSSLKPHFNYGQGVGAGLVYMLTWNPLIGDDVFGMRYAVKYWYDHKGPSNCWWCNITGGEARCMGNYVNWTTFLYQQTDSTKYKTYAVEAARERFANENFTVPAGILSDPTGTSWAGDKPWQWNYAVIWVRELARVLDDHGDFSEADEMRGLVAQWQDFAYQHTLSTLSRNYCGTNYPTCSCASQTWPRAVYEFSGTGIIWSDAPDFWNTMLGSNLAGYGPAPTAWRDLWRAGIEMVGSGNNMHCPGAWTSDSFQKTGVVLQHSWDALRQNEGTLDLRPSSDHPSEVFWDD